MSRIGKLPISIPAGVKVQVSDENIVTVKGKLGELKQAVNPEITVKVEDNTVHVSRPSESKEHKSQHGLTRSLLSNMVTGVSEGFQKTMEVIGVGYRATADGQLLELYLGYSHAIVIELPQEVSVSVVQEKRANAFITLKSYDKQLLGQVAAKIRSYRKPEPYKGKGIKFIDEVIRRKAGKSASDK